VIVDLPDTTTSDVSARLVRIREEVGAMALTRVLTLVIVVDEAGVEDAIETANEASHVHPCRIIVIALGNPRGSTRLDGQLRVGGDAGASEVVVLRLYGELTKHAPNVVTPLLLADSPIVAWWPGKPPRSPATDPVGAMAQRRVTDATQGGKDPRRTLARLAEGYTDGDTDLSWSRTTLWRSYLAAALDQPPFEQIIEATVTGAPDSPSADLLAAWLAHRLKCPVSLARSRQNTGIISVRLERPSGPVDVVRPHDGKVATLTQPGQPQRLIALERRSDAECLADELRRLDPDEVYQDALLRGLGKVGPRRGTASDAVRAGRAPSPAQADRDAARLSKAARKMARQSNERTPT
jgi:glucose-6-phosphate dehydrogenase assembly protein OpcA